MVAIMLSATQPFFEKLKNIKRGFVRSKSAVLVHLETGGGKSGAATVGRLQSVFNPDFAPSPQPPIFQASDKDNGFGGWAPKK